MTVAELIEALKEYDPSLSVIMSKDAEGNNFSPVYEAEQAFYLAETTWYGECHEDADNGGVPALFLWPVN